MNYEHVRVTGDVKLRWSLERVCDALKAGVPVDTTDQVTWKLSNGQHYVNYEHVRVTGDVKLRWSLERVCDALKAGVLVDTIDQVTWKLSNGRHYVNYEQLVSQQETYVKLHWLGH